MTKVLNVHLGTVDENGRASIHPAWYYYFDDTKETMYIETGRHSKKMENHTKNDTIYFCVNDPSPQYKGGRGKGNVKVYYDINFIALIAQNTFAILRTELTDVIKKGQSVILETSPMYYSTWDFTKQ